jgi:hypothetical protein
MRHSARARLVVSIALIAFGLAVTWAAADGLINNTSEPRTEPSPASAADQIAGAAGESPTPQSDQLGAFAESSPSVGEAKERKDAAWCGGNQGCAREASGGEELAATWAPDSSGDGSAPTQSCAATQSCADRVVSLLPKANELPLDLPTVRECTSSIGGEAMCFDFAGGNYLVGDAPDDGEAELGFCTSSGYYYVSGPSPDGGAGGKCPDEAGNGNGREGDAPTARECTSSIGGDATCFDFGDGNYLVSDPLDDGEGELGFCTNSGYYFVSAPSARGEAGAKCPDAAPR